MDVATAFSAPSKSFKNRQRAFIVRMREDTKLPASCKLVCMVVAERWNELTGFAHPGLKRIAKEAGMSQSGVRKAIAHPRMAQYLKIQLGKPGSLEPNRYWPIEEKTTEDVGHTGAQGVSTFGGGVSTFGPEGEHTGALNHNNHIKNHKAPTASGRPSLAEEILQRKPWEVRQYNRLIDRIEKEQTREQPNESIYEKVERLQRIKERKGTIVAACDLDLAWQEAAEAGLAHVPDLMDQAAGAKPYWLDVPTGGGTVIEHQPLSITTASSAWA